MKIIGISRIYPRWAWTWWHISPFKLLLPPATVKLTIWTPVLTEEETEWTSKWERKTILFHNFPFFLVGLDKDTRITYKMRVPSSQNEFHSLWIDKGNKPKHPLLLVWDPHILHWSKNASKRKKQNKTSLLNSSISNLCQRDFKLLWITVKIKRLHSVLRINFQEQTKRGKVSKRTKFW